MENKGFFFYASFWDALQGLPDEVKFHILEAVIKYGLYGEEPEEIGATEMMAFRLIRPQIEACNNRHEKAINNGKFGVMGKEYGKLGGRPKKALSEEGDKSSEPLSKNPQKTPSKTPSKTPKKLFTEDSKTPKNLFIE